MWSDLWRNLSKVARTLFVIIGLWLALAVAARFVPSWEEPPNKSIYVEVLIVALGLAILIVDRTKK